MLCISSLRWLAAGPVSGLPSISPTIQQWLPNKPGTQTLGYVIVCDIRGDSSLVLDVCLKVNRLCDLHNEGDANKLSCLLA